MSFIVKGIDLPKEDEVMVITVWGDDKDGTAFISNKEPYIVVPINAIQIPKGHGAIKDTDKIIALYRRVTSFDKSIMIEAIQQSDTILEAESEE